MRLLPPACADVAMSAYAGLNNDASNFWDTTLEMRMALAYITRAFQSQIPYFIKGSNRVFNNNHSSAQ
jgi:hypothetical protein